MTETQNKEHLKIDDKDVILIGTAHVSKESVRLVEETIETEKPDTVCVELCKSRHDSIREENKWRNMDIVKVIREKKAFLLLSNLILSSFQKKIASKLSIKPGQEMITALNCAEARGAAVCLADRDVGITLSRAWRRMGLWGKMKILFQLLISFGDSQEIGEEEIERLKRQDVLEELIREVGKSMPVLKDILIDERDRYLAEKIKRADGKKIVAVVGAGHVPGIKRYWNEEQDIEALEKLPPRGKWTALFKWAVPCAIVGMMAFGFFQGGIAAGKDMIKWWILANGVMAGLGAVAAMAHPYTILAAVCSAPLTSLNPMIAAGWVAGLVEAVSKKPRVRDFESLSEDILTIRGFWRNKVSRVLLVMVFTNIGSGIGTVVAVPLLLKTF